LQKSLNFFASMLPYCTLPALLECYSKHQPPDSLNYKLKFSLLIMGVNPSNWRQELSVCIYIYIYIYRDMDTNNSYAVGKKTCF